MLAIAIAPTAATITIFKLRLMITSLFRNFSYIQIFVQIADSSIFIFAGAKLKLSLENHISFGKLLKTLVVRVLDRANFTGCLWAQAPSPTKRREGIGGVRPPSFKYKNAMRSFAMAHRAAMQPRWRDKPEG
jgi:hypothetical protein